MAITKKWTMGHVVLNSTQINQIQRYGINKGFEHFINYGSGAIDPTFTAIKRQAPLMVASTVAIAALLAAVPIDGLAISSAVNFWFQQKQQGGTLLASTNSMKIAAAQGMVIVNSIRSDHNEECSAEFQVCARSADGTTAPLAVTTGQTMPALTVSDQKFTCGPCFIGEDPLGAIKSFEFDPGFEMDVDDASGEVYPTWVSIKRRQPKLTLKFLEVDQVAAAALGQFGTLDSVPIAAFLKKIDKGGTRVADATAEHIRFLMQDGMYTFEDISGEDGGDQMATLTIRPTTGVAAATIISTTAAIEDYEP